MIMSTIVDVSALEHRDAAPRSLAAILKNWWIAYLSWRTHQLAAAQLRSMSGRELKDIGLHRTQIDAALRGDVMQDRSLSRYY
jgi:uncharacterized protein YjiS (DUF1127 family)